MISTIFFDLDGTLYPNNNGLWNEISSRIDKYMEIYLKIPINQVSSLREEYFNQFGTTLKGLQQNYKIDPEFYLDFVHSVPIEKYIKPNSDLIQILRNLKQSKWIFTNSDDKHTKRILNQLGILEFFDGIIDVKVMNYNSKPNPSVYKLALEISGNPHPQNCLFLDDSPKNLIPASNLGITTILVGSKHTTDNINHSITLIQYLTKEVPILLEYEN